MDRRTFVTRAAKALPFVAGALYLVGCSSPTIPSDVASVTSESTVVNGHSHTVGVSSSDQLHPVTTTYTSSSSLSHEHQVTLTADQLSTIATGGSVTAISTSSSVTGNHQHAFTFQGKK